jgi:hypothetical protein
MIEFVLGMVMLMTAGGLLSEVPFPRFIVAYLLIVFGSDLVTYGVKAVY